jgi:hypothetical protein
MGNEPRRIPPTDAPAEAIERITPRKIQQLTAGDVVITREQIPRVNTRPLSQKTQWRYRVSIHTDPWGESQVFSGFVHAAAAAEQLGAALRTRVMYVEDDVPSLLADYSPHT